MLLTSSMKPFLQISFHFCFSLVDIIYWRLETQISLNFSMLVKLHARKALMTWKSKWLECTRKMKCPVRRPPWLNKYECYIITSCQHSLHNSKLQGRNVHRPLSSSWRRNADSCMQNFSFTNLGRVHDNLCYTFLTLSHHLYLKLHSS
jgi:hypothetical protein